MLVDANLLLYAVDEASPFHRRSAGWLQSVLDGPRRVGFPWAVLSAVVRLSTHPRAFETPLSPDAAVDYVDHLLGYEAAWVPQPTERHAAVLGALVRRHQLRGNLVSDADLAALAVEHGCTVCSADTDFARFDEVRWLNPLAGR
ncbi:MAG TPA: TA system VapC family ribonuclease toxin [Verrucomicrobiae bacterium]|nr:TA system VapC family ribonuclease toxin [Verrucomicrobiae bacterium]